jgi:hypothetical protein
MNETVTEMVTRLWRAAPERVRWGFSRHPVDEVRNLEAKVEQLRAVAQKKSNYDYEAGFDAGRKSRDEEVERLGYEALNYSNETERLQNALDDKVWPHEAELVAEVERLTAERDQYRILFERTLAEWKMFHPEGHNCDTMGCLQDEHYRGDDIKWPQDDQRGIRGPG